MGIKTTAIKILSMKWILGIIIMIMLPTLSRAQQDSISYEKRGTTWYKVIRTIEGTKTTTVEDVYTYVDTLVRNALLRTLREDANQYREFKLKAEEKEKDYLLKLRQSDRQFRALFGTRPDLDSLSHAKQLLGNWRLDGVAVTITRTLRLQTLSINFLSNEVFWVNNNGREYFFKRGRNWVSDRRRLVPVD